MNNYKQGRIFIKALNEADTRSTDMSAEDWAKMCGLMHDYGHGYEFEEFTKEEAIKKIEAIAEELEAEENKMGRWSISKLKSAKESLEDAKESLRGLGMHSAMERLDYILDHVNEELEAEEEDE